MPTIAGPVQPALPTRLAALPAPDQIHIGLVKQCSSDPSTRWKMGPVETSGWLESFYPAGADGEYVKRVKEFKPHPFAGLMVHQPLGETPDTLSGTTDMHLCAGLIADLAGENQNVCGGLKLAIGQTGVPAGAPIRNTVAAFKRLWDETGLPQKHYMGRAALIPNRTMQQWPGDVSAALWHLGELKKAGVDVRLPIDTAGTNGWPVGSANWELFSAVYAWAAARGIPIEDEPSKGTDNVHAMCVDVQGNQIEGSLRTDGRDAFYSGKPGAVWPSWALPFNKVASGPPALWLTGHNTFQGEEVWVPQPGHAQFATYGDCRWTDVQRNAFMIGRLCVRVAQGYRVFYVEPHVKAFKTADHARAVGLAYR